MFENEITLESQDFLETYLQGFEYKTSGLSFSSLYMWREINQISWKKIGEFVCVAGVSNLEEDKEEHFLFPPLTADGEYDPGALRETLREAREIFEKNGEPFTIMLIPFHLVDRIENAVPGQFKFIPDRPNFDYVYKTQDLIELKGRDYHGKKNHLNYFLNHFKYEYVTLTSDMAAEAMQFIEAFNKRKNLEDKHERELLEMEEEAMEDVFKNIEKVGYLAGAILIDGKIEALSIGGYLGKKTVTVHVEKANTEFRGLYQAINNEFCKHVASHVKLINREEDMGLPGLRKAKLSYKPVKLIEKHIAVLKNPEIKF
ncbi:MAG: phosphatidylglycerol lysyltransferase domain-containing protein [Anaerovorax sp.]